MGSRGYVDSELESEDFAPGSRCLDHMVFTAFRLSLCDLGLGD